MIGLQVNIVPKIYNVILQLTFVEVCIKLQSW